MWYRIDFTKLAVHLLPPLLRSKFLVSLLRAMIVPLRQLYETFIELRSKVSNKLNVSANVIYLEKVMNDAFFLHGEIYIESPTGDPRTVLYLKQELQESAIVRKKSEGGADLFIGFKGESTVQYDFIVMVPTFLCTSLESKNADLYGWQRLQTIKNLLSIYKPAGKTYRFELYDYE